MPTAPGVMVAGICPACGGQNLGVIRTEIGNWLHCATVGCPRPTAVHEVLTTCSQPDHIVDLRPSDYSIQHPMIERLDGVLLDRCPLDPDDRLEPHAGGLQVDALAPGFAQAHVGAGTGHVGHFVGGVLLPHGHA